MSFHKNQEGQGDGQGEEEKERIMGVMRMDEEGTKMCIKTLYGVCLGVWSLITWLAAPT
jgi:hypothetical protein